MKKFMIFLLMAFLFLGTSQARSEAAHLSGVNAALHSWISPTSSSSDMSLMDMDGIPSVTVSPSQPQSLCLTCPTNTATFGATFAANESGRTLGSYLWFVNGNPTDSTAATFTFAGYPAGNYTVSCKATMDDGTSVLSNVVNVTVTSDIAVNIVGPVRACQNDIVTLTAQIEGVNVTGATYQWRRNGNYIVGATGPVYSFNVASLPGLTDTLVYEFDVEIVRNGCENIYSPVHYFSVTPAPVTVVEAPLFCDGDAVTMTAQAYTAGSELPYKWLWVKNDEDTTTTYVNSLTVNAVNNDIYTVYPIYQDFACNAAKGETTLRTYQDSLNIGKALSISLEATAPVLCSSAADSIMIVDTNNVDVLGAASYKWYMDGQLLSGVEGKLYVCNLTEVGTHTFSVVATYANYPCEHPSANTSVVVDVAPYNVAINGDNVICFGDESQLVVTAENADSYLWSNGDIKDTVKVTAGVYTVEITSANGCKSISDPFTVYEFGADVHVIASATQICNGSSVVLNANADGWNGNVTYTWEDGSHYSSRTVVPTETTVYRVTSTVVSTSGVIGSCSRVDSVEVAVLPVPEITAIDIDNANVCAGSQVVLTAVPDTFAYYTWYADGIEIPGHNLDSVILRPYVGNHYYSVKASNGACASQVVMSSVPVVVNPNPTLIVTGDPLICNDSLITLYANINDTLNTGGNYTYEWRVYNYTASDATSYTDPETSEDYSVVSTGPTLSANFPFQDHAYIFQAIATNDNGCVSRSNPYPVYVKDTIFVAVTLDYDSVCTGGEVTATAHLGNYNTTNLVYQWFKNGELVPYATEPWFTTDITEDETVLSITVTQTTTGCTATGADTAYIVEPAVVSSVVAINGSNDGPVVDVCEGAQISVVAYIDENGNTDSTLTYVWKENGFVMPLAHDYKFSKQVWILDEDSANYTYEAFVDYNIPGCHAVPVSSNTVHVRRNPIVIIEGVHNVCFHDVHTPNVALTGWVDGNVDNDATYNWYRNGYLTDNYLAHDNLYYEMVEPTYNDPVTYMLEVINGDGCSSFSEPFQVEVYAAPVVNILASETNVCQGGVVNLEARINNYNDPMLTYQWYENELNNAHILPGRTLPNETFTVDQTTTYYVHVTHLMNDNTGGHTICDAYDAIQINVNPDPTIAVTNDLPASKTLCDGRSVTFEATVTPGVEGGEVFTWYRNGEIIPDAVAATFTETVHAINDYPTTYVYAVSVKQSATGCESTVFVADTVTVNPNPTVVITTDPIVCDNAEGNITMVANVNPAPTTDYTFNWFEENVALTGATGEHNETIVLTRDYRDYAYNFSVSLDNQYGCQAVAEAQIYVDTLPVINITATETEICVGGEITLTANLNNWNTPNMQYQWFDNGTAIAGATSISYTVAPTTGEHVYTFGATQLNSLCNAISNEITVNVAEDPTLTVSNDLPVSRTLCDGRSVTFVANVNGGVAGGEVYTWYRNGEIIPNAVGQIFTETVHAISDYPTTYVYAVSVKQTAAGCESSVVIADTVTVNPNPTVAITTDPIVCVNTNGNIVMTANVNPAPTTDYSFNWFEENVVLSGATGEHNETITLTRQYRDYPYNFSVSLVNAYGCQAVAEAQVYVDTVPTINIAATETYICDGGEITLSANLNNWNTPNMAYQWYDNGSIIPGATSLNYTVAPSHGTHNYTFAADQLNSHCNATSTAVEVNVNSDPTLTVTTDLEDVAAICDGRSVTFTATVEGGVAGGEVYTWYRNGEIIPNAVSAVFTETVHAINNYPTTYTYAVSVKQTAAGCESSVVEAATFTVNPNPTVVITTDPIVCVNTNGNITMTANVNPAPTTDYSFNWFEENVELTGATGTHNEVITLTRDYRDYPYNFSVSLVNEYGCQAVAEAQVYVDTTPVVNIVATETNICEGGVITLTANLNNWNTPNMTYQWFDNNVAIAGATSLTYTVAPEVGSHEYSFVATQLNSLCNATSNVVNVTVNEDPVIASVVMNNYNVCEGSQIAITANADNYTPSNDDVYTWYRNGILMPNATAQTIYDSPVTVDNNTQQFIYTAVVTRAAAGCTSQPVNSSVVTVYPNPTVVITGDQHVCETDSIFLIANVDTIGSNVGTLHYTWFESGMIRDNMAYNLGDNQFYGEYWYARTEPYRFTVEVQREGVAAACAARSAEFLVYVYPQPVVNITATETEICENGEVTLTANLVDPNATDMIYQWYEIRNRVDSFAVGFDANHNYVYAYQNVDYRHFIPGANSATYTTNLSETKTLGVVVYQTPSSCSDNDEITITVNPRPVVNAITVNDAANAVVCNGAQVNVAASITPADAQGAVFTWYRNGIEIPGANQSTFSENVYTTDNHVTTNVYTAMVTLPASGCVSAISAAHADVTINPAPTYVSITGNNVICENDSTTLTVSSDVDGIITWSNGSHASTITVPAGTYTATVATNEGCEMTSDVFAVTAFGSDLFVTASETSICRGEHTTLYANQDGYVGNVTYAWDANANNSVATTVDVQPETTTTYHVTATVNSTNGSCSVTGEVTIIVNQLPEQLTVTANTTAICQNQQVTFTATGADANAYIWYQNGVEIPGENQSVLTVNFPADGIYTFAAKAVNAEGCVSALASEPVTVAVRPAPSTVSITGNNVICENDQTILTAHSDVLGTFTWNDGTVGSHKTVVAGVYNVTLTTPEGCSMTSDNFEVYAFGSAVQVTASETAICQGEHTTLYASENGWQGNVTYTWSNGSHASSIDVTPAVTTTYYVTSSVNSTNGSCSRVDSITIIVTPRPAQVNIAATAANVCEGEQVTFTADGAAYAYTWYQNGVEVPGENLSTLTVNFPIEGSYTFQAKAINEEGCVSNVASAPVTVAVHAAPDMVVVSGNTEICGNGHTTLYANVTPNVAGATYQWYKNNVAILNGTGHYLTVAEAGSYKVVVTTNNCATVSDAVDVTVQEAPQLQLTANETTICQNGSAVITAEATGWNNANVNYNWTSADIPGFNFQGSAYTFAPAIAGDYNFTVTASQATSGCVSVDNITIHVNPAPAAPVLTVDNAVICESAQITLTLTDTNDINYGVPTIAWFDNGAAMAGAQNSLTINPAIGTHAYTASVTYPFSGCNTVYSAAANVTVLPVPTVAVVTSGNTTLCAGGSTTFTANVTPAGAYTYQWYVDNAIIAGANEASYTVADAIARETAYNYSVVVNSLPGCQVVEAAPALTVVADPVVVASVNNSIICEGGQATFAVTVDGGVANVNGLNGYTYAWYVNTDNTTPVATTPVFTVNNAVAGAYAYQVVVTSPYGCQTASNIVNFNVVSDPTVAVAVAQGYPTTVCDGGTTTLIANVAGGFGTPSYQWYKNGVAMNGETFETLTVSNLAYGSTDVYTVTVAQSGVDCIASSMNTANPFTVVPAYTVSITGNNNTCPGGTITLAATVNGLVAGDVPTYQWYRVNNGTAVAINGATSATYTTPALLLGDSYDYYVEVSSSISGCSVVSGTVPASVVAAPTVEIVGSHSVCENGQLPLHAFVNGGVEGAPYTYTWNWTGASNGSAVTADATYAPVLAANDAANPYFFTVTVSRNDNTGCEATSAPYQLDVVAVPSVVLTANRGYVCQGGEVTFTANVTPAGNYNYAWTINGVANPTNAASVTTVLNNAGAVNATVEVSANNAMASCATTATISTPVQVVADPVVTIAANHTTMCAGGTTTLSVANITANNNVPTNYTYQWAVNGFEIAGAINNTFTQNLDAAGTYNYTLKVTQNGELGCVSEWSAPVTVLVAEQPTVVLNNADGLDICVGGSVTLNSTVTNYGNTVNGVLNSTVYGPMSFAWFANGTSAQVNNNVTSANNQLTQTLNNVGNYGYNVVVTPTGYACQPATSNTVNVSVNGMPTWTDVHVYYPDVCVGQQIDLIAGVTGGVFDGAGNTNGYIQWTVNYNGVTANVAGGQGGVSYDIPTVAGSYVYTPTFVGNIGSGCQFANTADVEQPVTVHAQPTAQFISGDGTTICANDPDASVEIVIAFTGGAPYYFEILDERTNTVLPGINTSLTDTYTFYVAPEMSTTYRIINLHNQWCDADAVATPAQVRVNVNAVEFVETTFRPVNCGDDIVISFNITSGNVNEAYELIENGTQIAAGTVANGQVIIPDGMLSEGTHHLTLVIGGCNYDITVIVPVDAVSSQIFGANLMEQRWDDVAIINLNANPRYRFVGFQWYRNNELIPGAIYKNYQEIGGLNGFYSVEITAVDEQTGAMVTFVTCPVEFNSASNLKVYPVPANVQQVITIELDLTAEELNGAVLDIFDATGKLVNHMTDLTPVTRVAGFKAQGTYFGRIVTGTNEIKTVKFVIVK